MVRTAGVPSSFQVSSPSGLRMLVWPPNHVACRPPLANDQLPVTL